MRKHIFFLVVLLFSVLFFNCRKEKTVDHSEDYIVIQENAKNLFGTLPTTAIDDKYKITPEKVALGKKLFFDKRLSKDQNQSCNTCHNLRTYGVDNNSFSQGDLGTLGGRNSPTVLNAAFHQTQFWDGRAKDVEEQAGGPILNPVEMNMPSKEALIKRLLETEYPKLFKKAFPNDTKETITYRKIQEAIASFERKLVTPARFDDFLNGDLKALTSQEVNGLKTFISVGCASCHSGKLLGGSTLQKFGVFQEYWKHTNSKAIDHGRFDVSKEEADKFVFKTPSLRNVEKTFPYFHDGSVPDLKKAIKIMGIIQLNQELTYKEVNDINAFLKTLTGELPEDLTIE
ncbi:cytochrome-c peroxidase [Aquimarina sp. I32.4]|uniref:cytochrome-c peroxidase n=1 Tax=Aquimarina sp. I32.4 TaxID=2053903 RepID=UPI000CDF2B29|nr:cytochrome-c peroxidase [Aquimarina sp. I32.4]